MSFTSLRHKLPHCAALALAVLLFALAAPVASAQSCDNTSLTGSFVFKMTGYTYDSYGNIYYITSVGKLTADGAGNLTGIDTFNYDGYISRRTVTGTYSLNEDCSGTFNFGGTFSSGTFKFEMETNADLQLSNPDEFEFTTIDGGDILTGTLKRQVLPKPATTNTGDTTSKAK